MSEPPRELHPLLDLLAETHPELAAVVALLAEGEPELAAAVKDGVERGWLLADCRACAHSVPGVGIDDLVCGCEGMDARWWDYELLNRPVCRLYQRPGVSADA